jgi:hypothetical protein
MQQQEKVMHKLFAIGLGIYLAGDPSLSMLSVFSESKETCCCPVGNFTD